MNFLSWMGYSVAQMIVNVIFIWIYLQVFTPGRGGNNFAVCSALFSFNTINILHGTLFLITPADTQYKVYCKDFDWM